MARNGYNIEQWLTTQTALKRAARDYFLGLKRTCLEPYHKKGRLNTGHLHRVVNGHVDVFKTRTETKLVNSAVSVLVDSSGSMSGKLYEQACAAGVLLGEVLSAVGVKVEIAGFTDWGRSQLVHDIHLPFGARMDRELVLGSMYRLSSRLSGNADGENVLIAYDRILKQDVDRRVIIVLSDGEPSGCSGFDEAEFLRKALALIKYESKFTNTHVWGVGIGGSNAVERFYENHIVVNDDLKMASVIMTLVKQAVHS